MWPDRSPQEVPIGHVTNGIHTASWIGPEMRALLERHLGPDWLDRVAETKTFDGVDAIPEP